jgi:V/A-type H+/Na+-transporting ATPase subunit C
VADVSHNAYLATRVALLATRLLSEADLARLGEAGAQENRPFFVEHGLAPLIADSAEGARHPLEQRIITVLLEEAVILSRALSGREREFIIYWVHRFELANLKAIIRGKMANEAPESIRDKLVEMGPFASLPVEDLLRTEDIAELLARLERSQYADIGRQARRVFEQQHELFAIDTTFDQRYYSGLVRRAAAIETDAGSDFKALMAAVIDSLNLVWLLRYRFAYQLAASQVWYLLIPTHYRLSSATLQELAQLSRFEDVQPAIPEPFHTWLTGATSPNDVSRILEARSSDLARKVVRRAPSSLTRAFAYMLLRDQDLRNVHVVLKGKSIKLAEDVIRAGLGFHLATAANTKGAITKGAPV